MINVLTLIAVRTLSDAVHIVDAALAVRVLAHKVDRREIQLSMAPSQVTSLPVVEVDGR